LVQGGFAIGEGA